MTRPPLPLRGLPRALFCAFLAFVAMSSAAATGLIAGVIYQLFS